MLYTLIKSIISLALRVYFRKVHVLNQELVSDDKPALIISNHPGSILDIIILTVFQKSKKAYHFLVPAEYMDTPLKKWFLGCLKCIPISKQEVGNELSEGNLITCREFLKNNGKLVLFIEQQEVPVKRLAKIDNHIAEVAFDSEASFGFNLGIEVFPVALNYAYFNMFRSDLTIAHGSNFKVADFKELYSSNKAEALETFSANIERRIKAEMVIIEDESHEIVTERLLTINRNDCEIPVFPWKSNEQDALRFEQIIAGLAKNIGATSKSRFEVLTEKTNNYFEKLTATGLNDKDLSDIPHYSFFSILLVVLTAPVFLMGWLLNSMPLWISHFYTKAKVNQMQYYSTVSVLSGIGFYFLYILTLISIPLLISGAMEAAIVFFVTIITGCFALYYQEWGKGSLETMKYWMAKSETIELLKNQRKEIIEMMINPVKESLKVEEKVTGNIHI